MHGGAKGSGGPKDARTFHSSALMLKSAKASDLPVQQPTAFHLVIKRASL